MSVVVRRVLLVNDNNSEMAVSHIREFGAYVQKMCAEARNFRTSVLLGSERLQSGTAQVSFEFELPDTSTLQKNWAFDDDSERWFCNWHLENESICIDYWTETWSMINH